MQELPTKTTTSHASNHISFKVHKVDGEVTFLTELEPCLLERTPQNELSNIRPARERSAI